MAKANESAGLIERARQKREELSADQRAAYLAAKARPDRGGSPTNDARVQSTAEALESVDAEIVDLSANWTAWWRLAQRSVAALKAWKAAGDGKHALVVAGSKSDLEVALELESPHWELWERICEDSKFFPSVDAGVAAMERGRLYDQGLARADMRPQFFQLDREDLIDIGNAYADFLHTRLGPEVVREVMAGERTLSQVGIHESDLALVFERPRLRTHEQGRAIGRSSQFLVDPRKRATDG